MNSVKLAISSILIYIYVPAILFAIGNLILGKKYVKKNGYDKVQTKKYYIKWSTILILVTYLFITEFFG